MRIPEEDGRMIEATDKSEVCRCDGCRLMRHSAKTTRWQFVGRLILEGWRFQGKQACGAVEFFCPKCWGKR